MKPQFLIFLTLLAGSALAQDRTAELLGLERPRSRYAHSGVRSAVPARTAVVGSEN